MDQILNSDIRKLIELSLLNPPKKIELEARFTDYHLDQGIDIRTFYRLSKYFENYKSENTSSIDRTYIPEKLRYTIITAPGKPPEKILIRKETLKRFPEVTNYYKFKISLSTEETVNITKEYINRIDSSPSKDLLTRIKNRTSYYVTDDVRVDMTKVEETKNDISISKYELELELINYPAIQEWYSQILNILRLMQNTEIIYTFNDYSTLLSNVNKYLDNPNFTQLGIDNTKVLMDARNLKFRDLVYGGIVGSKIGDVNVGYRVTVKSDGERKLMVINNDGIWFIWNNEVNKFHSSDEFTARYNGYIFDGELIPRSAQKEVVPQKYWYLIFDLINYNDGKVIDRSIRKEPHSVRMRFAQGVKNYIVENNVATRDLSNILLLETKR